MIEDSVRLLYQVRGKFKDMRFQCLWDVALYNVRLDGHELFLDEIPDVLRCFLKRMDEIVENDE